MARTRVSPKYQVVIPKEIRNEVGIRPGQELQVVSKGWNDHPDGQANRSDARLRPGHSHQRLSREEGSILILIDSSGWLEFFSDGPLAGEFAGRLAHPQQILTPTVVLHEVYKWIKRERSEEDALAAVASMRKTRVVPLTNDLALAAADISLASFRRLRQVCDDVLRAL